jgi:hypothetical protein
VTPKASLAPARSGVNKTDPANGSDRQPAAAHGLRRPRAGVLVDAGPSPEAQCTCPDLPRLVPMFLIGMLYIGVFLNRGPVPMFVIGMRHPRSQSYAVPRPAPVL